MSLLQIFESGLVAQIDEGDITDELLQCIDQGSADLFKWDDRRQRFMRAAVEELDEGRLNLTWRYVP